MLKVSDSSRAAEGGASLLVPLKSCLASWCLDELNAYSTGFCVEVR